MNGCRPHRFHPVCFLPLSDIRRLDIVSPPDTFVPTASTFPRSDTGGIQLLFPPARDRPWCRLARQLSGALHGKLNGSCRRTPQADRRRGHRRLAHPCLARSSTFMRHGPNSTMQRAAGSPSPIVGIAGGFPMAQRLRQSNVMRTRPPTYGSPAAACRVAHRTLPHFVCILMPSKATTAATKRSRVRPVCSRCGVRCTVSRPRPINGDLSERQRMSSVIPFSRMRITTDDRTHRPGECTHHHIKLDPRGADRHL